MARETTALKEENMKALIVTGCPRSGTTFYSMNMFQNVDGFLCERKTSYEPPFLEQVQCQYLAKHKDIKKLQQEFFKFISTIDEGKNFWNVIKQPYFSFIMKELLNLQMDKKILVTRRDRNEILNSRLNYVDSIAQATVIYENTWLARIGIDEYKQAWEESSVEDRLKLYVIGQQKIEESFYDHKNVIVMDYGQNPVNNVRFMRELAVTEKQANQLDNNFKTLWKDKEYELKKENNKKNADAFKANLNGQIGK